jgi:virginiamycin B lyase
MTRQTFRSLLSVAGGIVLLSAVTFTSVSAAPLNASRHQRGLFHFEIFQLKKHTGPTFLLRGGDGNLWFSNVGKHQIASFDIARGQLRTFPLRPTSRVLVMSNAPDGNVWFADHIGNRGTIASITPDGKITEIGMPRGTGAAGLGPGPDGNLWVTEGIDDRIARFDLRSRTFKEFKLPHPRSGPCKIATGSDHAVWFTELGGGRIGRISLDGHLTEFKVPTPNAQPFMIVSGPDGAFWFTEYNAGKIGRITTSGEITEFRTSSTASFPMHIVVGADKNLWFTEVGSNALGRITLSGELTEFAFGGRDTSPDGITVGADNRVWFTQYAANALGVVLSAP